MLVPGVMKTTVVVDDDIIGVSEQQWGLMPTAVVSLGAIARIQLSGGPPPRGMKGMGRQTIDTVTMQRPDDVELEFLPLDATDEKELARKRDQKRNAQKMPVLCQQTAKARQRWTKQAYCLAGVCIEMYSTWGNRMLHLL